VTLARQEPAPPPGAWPAAVVGALALTVLLVYLPTLASMAGVWARSDTFAHGMLVLPVAGWLLYRQRMALAASRPRPCPWGLPALALGIAAWLLGSLVQADVVRQFSVMAMIPALVLLVLGPEVLRAAAFPLGFALLCVPVGEFLIAPMMNLTADGSVRLLQATGVPVYQDGWLLSIPAGDFQVADACSGVRYLIGAASSGLLFSWLFYRSWKKRLFFMVFVIVLTVMANVLRAYIIILLAHWSDMRLAAGIDHFIYGWFLFAVLLALLFAVGLRHADPDGPVTTQGPGHFMAALARRPAAYAAAAVAGLSLLGVGPLGLAGLDAALADEGPRAAGPELPVRLAGARMSGPAAAPAWLQAEPGWEMEHRTYRGSGDFEVHLFRGGRGPGGHDLTPLRERLAGSGVVLVDERVVNVDSGAGTVAVRQMRLREGANDITVAYWFAVGGERTANPITAKIAEVRTIMQGEHKKPALIAVALDTKGLDQPGDSLHAIIAELATAMAACAQSERAAGSPCDHG
jgi:exosortase A